MVREFNPQLLRILGNLAEAQRRDAEWIASLVASTAPKWFTKHVAGTGGEERIELAADGWDELPKALARRIAVLALGEMGAGRDLSRTHIERTLAFLRGGPRRESGKTLELPGGLALCKHRSGFVLRRATVRAGDSGE